MFRAGRKFSIAFIGLFATLLLSGCSWQSFVYVVNMTKMPLVVRVSLNNGAVSNGTSWQVTDLAADKLSLGDTVKVISRVEANGVRYVELPPQSALRIWESIDYNLREEADCRRMLAEIKSIETLSPNDATFQCKEVSCLPQLQKLNAGQAAFVIR